MARAVASEGLPGEEHLAAAIADEQTLPVRFLMGRHQPSAPLAEPRRMAPHVAVQRHDGGEHLEAGGALLRPLRKRFAPPPRKAGWRINRLGVLCSGHCLDALLLQLLLFLFFSGKDGVGVEAVGGVEGEPSARGVIASVAAGPCGIQAAGAWNGGRKRGSGGGAHGRVPGGEESEYEDDQNRRDQTQSKYKKEVRACVALRSGDRSTVAGQRDDGCMDAGSPDQRALPSNQTQCMVWPQALFLLLLASTLLAACTNYE